MGYRRKARELALQLLFHYEFNKETPDWRKDFWKDRAATDSVQGFADQLVSGVVQNQKTIDDLIEKHAEHWSLDRMTAVDRNVLRIAVYELMYVEEIPSKVTINEAIEIAKRYGDEGSGAFVNGILDHIIREEDSCLERGKRGIH